ncbi:MAG: PTS sugar transporter subunit IIA [Verrucomicrobiae bacterium]|nr:PTS sugar transporter subunit IIA [Verrucomicrobiae bacterium]
MKRSGILRPEVVAMGLRAGTRDEAIAEIVGLFARDPRVTDRERLLAEILAREASESTCLGFETAIPHARTDAVREMAMAVGRSEGDVRFGCGKVAKLIFVVATPRPMATEYLRFVGALARAMRSEDVRAELMGAGDAAGFIRILAGAGVV